MSNVFLISDTHFGHQRMYEFIGADEVRVREGIKDAEEGDNLMVQNWNNVVKDTDKVYHLGDVFINRKYKHVLDRLNGKKILIKGNHDIFELDDYLPYFKDIRAYHKLNNMILSHVPVHDSQLESRFKYNIHGHLHEKTVTKNKVIDTRYISVCVEKINYTPIAFDDLVAKYTK